ncbi:MAG: SDR family oxidoreductase [Gammaproteobacteria bacterium]|nr:SDR family oxidoreductase [Gammaproteobacteria bacterium]
MAERRAAPESVPPLVGQLPPQCRRDVDDLRRFVHSTIARESPAAPVSASEFREVLLTGATGFVGRFLLRELLRQDDRLVVHCLVRADGVEQGLARIRAAMEHADIWDEALAPRIRVVIGDLRTAGFGLNTTDFDALCRRIDAVYHLAADVNLVAAYRAIREMNVVSLRNVIELCVRIRYKHLFYFSTMGVFPEYFCDFANEFMHRRIEHHMQPDLASMKKTFPIGFAGYPWTKLSAEQGVLFAHAAGLPVAIFRLPQTAMSSMGFTLAQGVVARIFCAAVQVEMAPAGYSVQRQGEPADTLAELCVAISTNPQRRFTVYHCCDPKPPYEDFDPADFGIYWREVPYDSFRRACQAFGERSPLHGQWNIMDHFEPYWFGDRKPGSSQPVCDRAIREDCPYPIEWPAVLVSHARSYNWVRNQGDDWPFPVPRGRLDFDRLIARCGGYAERMGVPFGQTYPVWMRAGLQRLVEALNAPESGLLERRVPHVVYGLNRQLRANAALARERRQHPEIAREPIVRPLFIVGINRTGTTLLHRLMARDRRFWAVHRYELTEPVLSTGEYATVAHTADDPRRGYLKELMAATGIADRFAGLHHIDIDEPEEDFPILRLAFAAWIDTVAYHVPDYGAWLAETGSRHAYAHHRRVMQHFTWQRRQREQDARGQWLLKMPFHLMELEALIETYPDARFIQTHREPRQFMGSWNSMVERIRSITTDPRPRSDAGAEQLALMSGMLNRAMQFRMSRPELEERWIDVNYVDLVENPLAMVRKIYERLGWRLEPAARDDMQAWLSRMAELRRQEPRHRYCLEDFALTPEAVDTAFAPYRDFMDSRGIRESCV